MTSLCPNRWQVDKQGDDTRPKTEARDVWRDPVRYINVEQKKAKINWRLKEEVTMSPKTSPVLSFLVVEKI